MTKDYVAYNKFRETVARQMTEINNNSQVDEIVKGIRSGKKYLLFHANVIPEFALTTTLSVESVSDFHGDKIAYLEVNSPKPYNKDHSISANVGIYFLEIV